MAAWLVFVLAALYNLGKGLEHQTQDREWARRPLIRGLALSDVFHIASGLSWPIVLFACFREWELDWRWWVASLVLWGAIWPLTKWEKAKVIGWRAVMAEAFYCQIGRWIWSKLPLRQSTGHTGRDKEPCERS